MMRKRIAIFTHGGIGGGYENQGFPRLMQIVGFLSDEYRVEVFTLEDTARRKKTGYPVHGVPSWVKPRFLKWLFLIVNFVGGFMRQRYDLLFSFWGYPMGFLVVVLGRLFRKPSMIYLLGAETASVPQINYGHIRRPFSRRLVCWACLNATEVIVVSNQQKNVLNRLGLNRKIHIVPIGADSSRFHLPLKPLASPLKILHVANLTPVKDQHTLLRTFELIRHKIPAKLRIVGPDYYDGEIQKSARASSFAADIEFTGFVSQNKIVDHYQWADAFLLTSLSEGQNGSITDAMMCGLLPISTAVGHMDFNLGSEVGVVADCGDALALAQGVLGLYQSPAAWEQKRRKARDWALKYDIRWTISQLSSILNHAK